MDTDYRPQITQIDGPQITRMGQISPEELETAKSAICQFGTLSINMRSGDMNITMPVDDFVRHVNNLMDAARRTPFLAMDCDGNLWEGYGNRPCQVQYKHLLEELMDQDEVRVHV